MGTLANSLFQTLMGWIRTLCSEIWKTASSPKSTTFLAWIGSNWKTVALILCTAGLITDLIVYLFRWQPYRVWRSFFRRLVRSREEEEDSEKWNNPENAPIQEAPITSDEAYFYQETAEKRERETDETMEEPLQTWRRMEPEGTTESFEQAILPRRRRVTRLFSEPGEKDYATPDQLIDRYEAYRRPVYPRGWNKEEEDQEDQA